MSKVSEQVKELEAEVGNLRQQIKHLEDDERIDAWMQIANHPFFNECYDEETSLLAAMRKKLDGASDRPALPTEPHTIISVYEVDGKRQILPVKAFRRDTSAPIWDLLGRLDDNTCWLTENRITGWRPMKVVPS